MDQITTFFENLFNTAGFIPLRQCGHWTSFTESLFVIGHLAMILSCFFIPALIIKYKARQQYPISEKPVFSLFITFILFYGITLVLDLFNFWVPLFQFSSLMIFLIAIFNLLMIAYLFIIFRKGNVLTLGNDKEINLFKIENKEELKTKDDRLRLQNEKLDEIAWMGSHRLRGPVASILGLSKLFNHDNYADPDNAKIIEGIHTTARDLDKIIKELVEKASTKETA